MNTVLTREEQGQLARIFEWYLDNLHNEDATDEGAKHLITERVKSIAAKLEVEIA